MATHRGARGTGAATSAEALIGALGPQVVAIKASWAARDEHLWLASVAVPLEMVATGLLHLWWTWPILLADAWALSPTWRWSWLLSLEEGFVGMQWASIGAILFAEFIGAQLIVGAVWIAFPVSLATAGAWSRRRK
jgi:hypothetical protein